MARFDGKVALVTGAARGIGRAIAIGLAKEGANVALNDIVSVPHISYSYPDSEKKLDATVKEIEKAGGNAIGILADVSQSAQVADMVNRVIKRFGKIDIAVNNAGILDHEHFLDLTEESWDQMIAVCLKGPFLCSKYVAPHMARQKYGRIVNIASHMGLVAGPLRVHYVAAKHGVIGLTKGTAVDLAPYNITVNAVCPGKTDTDMATLKFKADESFKQYERIRGAIGLFPERDKASPEDIAAAVLWLASDEARNVTGITLPVDMGYTVK